MQENWRSRFNNLKLHVCVYTNTTKLKLTNEKVVVEWHSQEAKGANILTVKINGKPAVVIQSHSWVGLLKKIFEYQKQGYTIYESLSGHNSKAGTIIKLTMVKDQYLVDTSVGVEFSNDSVIAETEVKQEDQDVVLSESPDDTVVVAESSVPDEKPKRGRKKVVGDEAPE